MQRFACLLFFVICYSLGNFAVQAQQEHVIDDSSDVITYSTYDDWWHYTGEPDAGEWFLNTSSSTNVQGAYAEFTFTGVEFEYWGNLGQDKSNATLEFDGQNNTIQLYANPVASNQLLWRIDNLSNTEHTVRIIQPNPTSDTSNLGIDRFIYKTDITGSFSESATTESGDPTATNTTDSPSSSDSEDSSNNSGAIIGGVLGGVAGMAIVAVAIWYFLRHRMSAHKNDIRVVDEGTEFQMGSSEFAPVSTPLVNPFVAEHTTSSLNDNSSDNGYNHGSNLSHSNDPAPSYDEVTRGSVV